MPDDQTVNNWSIHLQATTYPSETDWPICPAAALGNAWNAYTVCETNAHWLQLSSIVVALHFLVSLTKIT